MGFSLPLKWVLFGICYVFLVFYQLVLGKSGYLEKKEWERQLALAQWDLERVKEENKILLEQKKLGLSEQGYIDKEAKKYYIIKEEMGILKFSEDTVYPSLEEKEKFDFWSQLKENILVSKEEKTLPPLETLRVLYLGFCFFFVLFFFFLLVGKKGNDNNPNLKPIENDKPNER